MPTLKWCEVKTDEDFASHASAMKNGDTKLRGYGVIQFITPTTANVITWAPVTKSAAEPSVLNLTREQFYSFYNGEFAQNAFPDLSVDEREMLISGYSASQWNAIFGEKQ